MKKNIIIAILCFAFNSLFAQVQFLKIEESIPSQYKVLHYHYDSTDNHLANIDLDLISDNYRINLSEHLLHTHIKDAGIKMNAFDTVTLKYRAYEYTDSTAAVAIFNTLNKKVLSARSVPNFRIIYRVSNVVYLISLKDFVVKDKELKMIMTQVLEYVKKHSIQKVLFYNQDLRKGN